MRQHVVRRGDTLIEVMLSISIFALVAMITINMMNDGINTAQRTLEAEMARNEIDAQAEALRFIHNNYIAERQKTEEQSQFRKIWRKLTDNAIRPSMTVQEIADKDSGKSFDINDMNTCEEPYGTQAHLERFKSFVLNTRLIVPELSADTKFKYLGYSYGGSDSANNKDNLLNHIINYYSVGGNKSDKFSPPSLYPRIIYGKLNNKSVGPSTNSDDEANLDEGEDIYNDIAVAEGIWIDAVSNIEVTNKSTRTKGADYYDFYIRTCWHAAGVRTPSTITTVVRLYNPEIME